MLTREILDDLLDLVGRVKAVSTILAPCPARALAIPSPIPLVEPVMMAVLAASISFPLKPLTVERHPRRRM
jgi:hypothetical protein